MDGEPYSNTFPIQPNSFNPMDAQSVQEITDQEIGLGSIYSISDSGLLITPSSQVHNWDQVPDKLEQPPYH